MSSPPNPIAPGMPLPLADLFKQVSFQLSGVPPPWQLYTTAEDVVSVRAFSSVVGAQLDVTLRWMRVDGQLVLSQSTLTLGSARALQAVTLPVQEGFLIAVSCAPKSATVIRGSVFTNAVLVRVNPQAAQGFNALRLFSDYAVAFQDLGYPTGRNISSTEGPGLIRTITGTTPGLGAEITETVPTGARWRLQALSATLVTSATVATRAPHLIIDDGVNILFEITANGTQAASLTQRYSAGNSTFSITSDAAVVQIPLSEAVILQPGWRIRTLTTAIQAGDQYSAPQYSVEEWING